MVNDAQEHALPACLSAGGAVLPAAGSCRHAAVTLARSGNADAASCLRPALPPGAGDISGTPARLQHAHVLGEGDHVTVTASASADAAPAPGDGMGYGGGAGLKLLLIAGQPIREPIVQHGARVLLRRRAAPVLAARLSTPGLPLARAGMAHHLRAGSAPCADRSRLLPDTASARSCCPALQAPLS